MGKTGTESTKFSKELCELTRHDNDKIGGIQKGFTKFFSQLLDAELQKLAATKLTLLAKLEKCQKVGDNKKQINLKFKCIISFVLFVIYQKY